MFNIYAITEGGMVTYLGKSTGMFSQGKPCWRIAGYEAWYAPTEFATLGGALMVVSGIAEKVPPSVTIEVRKVGARPGTCVASVPGRAAPPSTVQVV